MKRIIMHWTAGDDEITDDDRKHYHEIVNREGWRMLGIHKPEANLNPKKGRYAAHTRALNTGSIGLAMDAMKFAREHPFDIGPEPITITQLRAFVGMVAEYCDTYKIEVTRRTVLTHAEVQPTLGVWQRGKWDICWLPGMTKANDPIDVGDALRRMISQELDNMRRVVAVPMFNWLRRSKVTGRNR